MRKARDAGLLTGRLHYSISFHSANATVAEFSNQQTPSSSSLQRDCKLASSSPVDGLQTGNSGIEDTDYFSSLRQLISSQHSGSSMSQRSSIRPLLQAPRTQTGYGSRAFSSAVPVIWNKLPTTVLEVKSLPVFRRQLKSHLFTVAFDTNWSANCNVASAAVPV